ncbi:hypothetical protein FJZ19_05575 [Candidatus Pacearchaeota archaeon]|nr:hypothetical protein [Candidatus Pacearchaeota archaeon]
MIKVYSMPLMYLTIQDPRIMVRPFKKTLRRMLSERGYNSRLIMEGLFGSGVREGDLERLERRLKNFGYEIRRMGEGIESPERRAEVIKEMAEAALARRKGIYQYN